MRAIVAFRNKSCVVFAEDRDISGARVHVLDDHHSRSETKQQKCGDTPHHSDYSPRPVRIIFHPSLSRFSTSALPISVMPQATL